MTKYNYAKKELKENQAKAVARDAPVSFKSSIETAKYLKNKTTAVAKAYLEKVVEKKAAIPYTRYTNGLGHRKGNGMAAGRYPVKLSKVLIKLLKNVEANASMKGLGEELKIIHFVAQKASVPMHYGRHARREMKRSHVEIIVEEIEDKKAKVSSKKKTVQKDQPKKEDKKSEVKAEPKVEVKEEKKPEVEETKKEEPKVEVKIEKVKTEVKPEPNVENTKIQEPTKNDKQVDNKIEDTK